MVGDPETKQLLSGSVDDPNAGGGSADLVSHATPNVTGSKEPTEVAPDSGGDSGKGAETPWTGGDDIVRTKGMNWMLTGLFVVGDMAGGGLVALPTALVRMGFIVGMANSFLMIGVTLMTACMLGFSWTVMLQHWPEYRAHCRAPYPEMAYRAFGKYAKYGVSLCINLTQFGVAVVFVLLTAKNIQDFAGLVLKLNIHFCFVVLFLGGLLWPVIMLKSPQDFWGAIVFSMFSTFAACILLIVGSGLDYKACIAHVEQPKLTAHNMFTALGTYLFSYGGHSSFPTIQHDMKRPKNFWKSCVMAFTIMFILYIPVCALGYFVYGDSVRESVINNIQHSGLQIAVNFMIMTHCFLTLAIVFNPLNQDVEQYFNVPQNFGWKRCVVRTIVLGLVIFVAESIPAFDSVLDLVGGSTLCLTSIVFPVLFYTKLSALQRRNKALPLIANSKDGDKITNRDAFHHTPYWLLAITGITVLFGCVIGCAATYSAIYNMARSRFMLPCYVIPFMNTDQKKVNAVLTTVCCGHYQNITSPAGAGKTCADPKMNFFG
uniref:Aa_trans domain-containing protein n=1 Tax=Panagrellus redivivus TaxID=6233 RepID=A0A7E4VYT4_PANRE